MALEPYERTLPGQKSHQVAGTCQHSNAKPPQIRVIPASRTYSVGIVLPDGTLVLSNYVDDSDYQTGST